jgi:hypothetical protein
MHLLISLNHKPQSQSYQYDHRNRRGNTTQSPQRLIQRLLSVFAFHFADFAGIYFALFAWNCICSFSLNHKPQSQSYQYDHRNRRGNTTQRQQRLIQRLLSVFAFYFADFAGIYFALFAWNCICSFSLNHNQSYQYDHRNRRGNTTQSPQRLIQRLLSVFAFHFAGFAGIYFALFAWKCICSFSLNHKPQSQSYQYYRPRRKLCERHGCECAYGDGEVNYSVFERLKQQDRTRRNQSCVCRIDTLQ